MEVVGYLSTNNLMGNWGGRKPPEWLVNHFNISIRAIERYMPTPMQGNTLPDICVIWAKDGVLEEGKGRTTGLDMEVKITKMLIERKNVKGAMGWDKLFPGAKIEVANTPGNHFTIVHPPNVSLDHETMRNIALIVMQCSSLSALLRDSVGTETRDRTGLWKQVV